MGAQKSKPPIWDRNNGLFLYGNEQKLDDLLSRAYGEVVSQLQLAEKDGIKGTMKFAAKFGAFLAFLGLAEGSSELGGEVSLESARTKIAAVSFENKLNALYDYCSRSERFPYINTLHGKRLIRADGVPVPQWKAVDLTDQDKIDSVGIVLGLFDAQRMVPPHDEKANLSYEFMEQKKHLWLFSSIRESEIKTDVPVLLSNARLTSQHAILALAQPIIHKTSWKIEACGLLSWKDSKVTCDPVAWRIFY